MKNDGTMRVTATSTLVMIVLTLIAIALLIAAHLRSVSRSRTDQP